MLNSLRVWLAEVALTTDAEYNYTYNDPLATNLQFASVWHLTAPCVEAGYLYT